MMNSTARRLLILSLSVVLSLAFCSVASAKKKTKRSARLPWKSKIFLDMKPFQKNFGSVKQLKSYMAKNGKTRIGPADAKGMYAVHFMAFFKKVQPAALYILIFEIKGKSREFTQRFDFAGVKVKLDRFSAEVKLEKALVSKKKQYLWQLKAKTGRGAQLLAETRFTVF